MPRHADSNSKAYPIDLIKGRAGKKLAGEPPGLNRGMLQRTEGAWFGDLISAARAVGPAVY
jgi:hypothetical protein